MPRHATSTSFVPGHKRSPESIERQRQTLRAQYAAGLRKPIGHKWSDERRKEWSQRAKEGRVDRIPLGTRRLHTCSASLKYWKIKIGIGRKGWTYEHRYVAEQKLGRPLQKGEIAHHINGDTLDNRPENIAVMGISAHSSKHHKDVTSHRHDGKTLSPDRWAVRFDCCISCGQTNSKHVSKGQCSRCYQKHWRKTHRKTLLNQALTSVDDSRQPPAPTVRCPAS